MKISIVIGRILAFIELLTLTAPTLRGAVHYVHANSTTPSPPFTNWVTAANNIQDAVDVADVGDTVLVTNGIYSTGGRIVSGALTNRVAVTKALILESVNGPEVTVIQGYKVPGTTNNGCGDSAVRCVYLTNGAALIGFTLTNGATRTSAELSGGGIFCAATNASVSNCVVINNSSFNVGGGAYSGTLNYCALEGNSARSGGGGASDASLNNCSLTGNSVDEYGPFFGGNGGGAFRSTLFNCALTGNSAQNGGGANASTLNNCLLNGNSAYYGGGAATYIGGMIYPCTLTNCTLVGNSAANRGGGAYECTLDNSIIYFNSAPVDPNYAIVFTAAPWPHLNNSCSIPLPSDGSGNITNEPVFVDLATGDFHLQSNSPCINSGDNAYVFGATDLDGNPRIVNGTVDIGAYEFQPPDTFRGWLLSFGLPGNGSADFTDPDTDGADNWQEWRAGTIPTNTLSVLRMLPPVLNLSGVTLSWQSVTNRTYYLQSATNLSQSFLSICSNVQGQASITSVVDTNSIGSAPRFYRVGVE